MATLKKKHLAERPGQIDAEGSKITGEMRIRPQILLAGPLLCQTASAAETRSSESRPRGVGPEFAKFYKSSSPSTFTCISNPSISIPFSRINDDYCDCPDGSDEPGTAACSYLSPLSPPQHPAGSNTLSGATNSTLALPGFYCKNKGHIPSYIRFDRVNDGKCDYEVCCDGSDEWAGVGGTKCEDRCKSIGQEYRKHEELRQKVLRGALKRRKELATEAIRLKKQQEAQLNDIEAQIKAGEVKIQAAKDNLVEVERRESMKTIRVDSASRGGGKLGVLVGLAKNRVDELRKMLEKTRNQRDSMVARVSELEGLLSKLKEDYNPNFNDEGVKMAVRGWEDYAARDTDDVWSDAEDRDLTAILAEDSDSTGINWAEFEDIQPDSDVAALYEASGYLPAPLRAWIKEKVSSFRQILVQNGILPDSSVGSTVAESKAVQDAKKTVDDAEDSVSNHRRDADRIREDLDKDYGPEGIFRALKDKCIEKDSGEYTYELCWLGQTKQKPKKGGSHQTLGHFTGFDIEVSDDELPKDGKGLGTGERIVLKYENGNHCWNGPNRSTKVVLACAEKDEIWKVSESEKCVYRMEVGTAAVCGWRDGNEDSVKIDTAKKDEL